MRVKSRYYTNCICSFANVITIGKTYQSNWGGGGGGWQGWTKAGPNRQVDEVGLGVGMTEVVKLLRLRSALHTMKLSPEQFVNSILGDS